MTLSVAIRSTMTRPATAVCSRLQTADLSATVSPADCRRCADASYNKPFSVKAWLEQVDVQEDFVLMMDTDMFLRATIDPLGLGCSRGTVVSAKYSYLYGTTSGFARHFIDESLHERLTGVGGFHIFHREDLRQIAPLWLEYTMKVRAFANAHPDEYFNESFPQLSSAQPGSPGPNDPEVAVKHKQARWHGEMCEWPATCNCHSNMGATMCADGLIPRSPRTLSDGYVFAAALVGVTHRVREDVMLYPGNTPFLGRAPFIMHYGSDYTFGDKKAYFNKMSHQELRLETCPNFLFDEPWDGTILAHPTHQLSKQDALSTEHLATLNAAFCRFYARIGCNPLPERCGGSTASAFEAHIDAVQSTIARCRDEAETCASWARMGECSKNPLFMQGACAVTCKSCHTPVDEVLAITDERYVGDWKHLKNLKRGKQKREALAYIASAEEPELHELDDAVEARRMLLTQKFEL